MSIQVKPQTMSHLDWQIWWTLIFVANLPIALLLGGTQTDRFGRLGMATAIVLVWLLGLFGTRLSKDFARILVPGSACVVPLQFFPILHIFAGAFAVETTERFVHRPPHMPLSGAGGFCATIFTGAQLIFVAMLCGLVIREWTRILNERSARDEH
jgi:hypothetical protein